MDNSVKKIAVKPFKNPACAQIEAPGSKSITNRALLMAAMAGQKVEILRPLASRDSKIMAQCLKNLGFEISESENSISVSGSPKKSARLFVGNAGTAARFLTAYVCSIEGGYYEFDSDEEMRRRPMQGLIKALEKLGAKFEFEKEPHCFPFRVKTFGLSGGKIEIDAGSSSQILSAVLMASALAKSETLVELKGETVSKPFVKMTLEMMRQFGFDARETEDGKYLVKNSRAKKISAYEVEPDATAASYPIALAAAAGGAVLIKNFPFEGLQGDVRFADIMRKTGLALCQKVGGDLLVYRNPGIQKYSGGEFDFNDISDTFLTLAAIAPLFETPVKITGISHTRKQESDRVLAMRNELSKFAQKVEIGEDFIAIRPYKRSELAKNISAPVEIKTYKDHRVAMSSAVCGCADVLDGGGAWMEIDDPLCCAKTWPNFFDILEKARMDSMKFKIVAIDGGAAVGKSSVSKECSKTLNYMHVDTGAHYRTLAYILLAEKIEPGAGEQAVAAALKNIGISTVLDGNSARIAVCGRKIEDSLIRTDAVNQNVSLFAAMPCVREFLKGYQRSMADFAKEKRFAGLVMEGRDIGSVIFPGADAKIFLDADEETRRLRRAKEGISDAISKRDQLDKNRKTAPLVRPEGAELIDTSRMTKDEVVAQTLAFIIKA
ncbi:MAG: 3-phosphoshikimate 1-carboxyvinyltransferase [Opitutales bacterium]|nr:3-phosphoshikimate 1-carboxyvinyltransferase [Opitutales bacterium]